MFEGEHHLHVNINQTTNIEYQIHLNVFLIIIKPLVNRSTLPDDSIYKFK